MSSLEAFDDFWEHAEDFASLLELIKENNTEMIALWYAEIEDEQMSDLIDVMGKATKLKGLYLWENDLSDNSIKALVGSMKGTDRLTTLILRENRIGIQGAKSISELIKVNESITTISLMGNNIDDKGALALAAALKTNKTITSLDLRKNPIGSKGADQITRMFDSNMSICKIQLTWKGIKERARLQKQLRRRIGRNKKIGQLRQTCTQILMHGGSAKSLCSRMVLIGPTKSGKSSVLDSLIGNTKDIENDVYAPTVTVSISDIRTQLIKSATTEENQNLQRSKVQALLGEGGTDNSGSEAWEPWNGMRESQKFDEMLNQAVRRKAFEKIEAKYKILRDKYKAENQKISKAKSSKGGIGKEKKLSSGSVETTEVNSSKLSSFEGDLSHDDIDEVIDDIFLPQMSSEENIKSVVGDDEILVKAQKEHKYMLRVWDFGGEALPMLPFNQLFTSRCIYLYVFDMRMALSDKEDCLQVAKKWLSSVNMLTRGTSPILLVGTFLDKVSTADSKMVSDKILKPLLKSYPQILKNTSRKLNFFPIDNVNGKGTSDIRIKVEAELRNIEWVQSDISLRWLRCLDFVLRAKSHGADAWYTPISQVVSIAKTIGVPVEQVDQMLSYFHDLGYILYSKDAPGLNGNIIKNPQRYFATVRTTILLYKGETTAGGIVTEEDITLLRKRSWASRKMLATFWGISNVDFVVEFMRQSLFLVELIVDREINYLIPSMVLEGKGEVAEDVRDKEVGLCVFDFSKQSFPAGLFSRLVCLCVAILEKKKGGNHKPPNLNKDYAKIWINANDSIELQLFKENLFIVSSNEELAADCVLLITSALGFISKTCVDGLMKWELGFQLDKEESFSRTSSLMRGSSLRLLQPFGRKSAKRRLYTSYAVAMKKNLEPWFTHSLVEKLGATDMGGIVDKFTNIQESELEEYLNSTEAISFN